MKSNNNLILEAIINEHNIVDLSITDVKDLFNELEDINGDDGYLTVDGMEFRLIEEGAIWDIFVETIKDICEDCYGVTLPNFMQDCIDWEKVSINCYADGYGHTFSGYDGSELEAGGYYIFRTN